MNDDSKKLAPGGVRAAGPVQPAGSNAVLSRHMSRVVRLKFKKLQCLIPSYETRGVLVESGGSYATCF